MDRLLMRIAKIYNGSCVSLICEAKEVLIEEIFKPNLHILMNILMQKNIQMEINFSKWKNH